MLMVVSFASMSFDNVPPLVPSEGVPIILGSNKLPLKKLDSICDSIRSSCASILTFNEEHNRNAGIPNHHASQIYTNEDMCQSTLEETCLYEQLQRQESTTEMFGNIPRKWHFKKVQSYFVVVRKESTTSYGDSFQFGSHSTLPGEVESEGFEIEGVHENPILPKHRVSRFWNAKLQLQSNKENVKFIEYCRHFLQQIRKFISKLQQAIIAEENYVKRLDIVKLKYVSSLKNPKEKFGSSDSMYDSSSSGIFMAEDNDSKHVDESHFIKPPKLGKVYSEFRMHFKAWDDIMQKWQECRQHLLPEMLNRLVDFRKRIKTYQAQMLSLTQKLILARLRSFASCVTVRSKNDEAERDWDSVLGIGSVKRLCKLIDAYNKVLGNEVRQEVASINWCQSHVRSHSFADALPTTNENLQKLSLSVKDHSTIQFFSIARILNILASPAKDDLASTLLNILSVIQQSKSDILEECDPELIRQRNPNCGHVDWAKADEVDIDEDRVITIVAGYEVGNISDTKLSNESLSAVKQLLYAQGSFIVCFMNSLAANTSLLRGKSQTKSPRSTASSQAFSDDVSAVSSDDEVSSVASSSFFSQLSGTGGFSPRKRKTVLWRDSWDQEAVKSLSKSYMACLVTEGPTQSLLSRTVRPDQSALASAQSDREDDSGVNDQVLLNRSPSQNLPKCFRPRFWSEAKAFRLDASITNMITLDLLPDDVLVSVQEATQTFVIEKALHKWDRNMYTALGVSTNDKCGSLPVEGLVSLSKTTWSYVKAIHTLMFIMDRYNKREDAAMQALQRLESTLNAFHRWAHGKVQQFTSSWSLRPLMQVSLGDLSQITALGLNCLPLVEKCHNHIESRRMENPASLHLATKHLRNIDATITDMQSLSGDCMKMYILKCKFLCKKAIESSFPPHKIWRQNNLTGILWHESFWVASKLTVEEDVGPHHINHNRIAYDENSCILQHENHSSASSYMEASVKEIIKPICAAVSVLDARSQLAAVPSVMTAMLDAVNQYILQKNVRFSVQGAMQLQRDFEYVVEYVCSEEARMCSEVRRNAPYLTSVKRAMWVAHTLQRTDVVASTKSGKSGYEKSQRRKSNGIRSLSPTNDELGDGYDDDDWHSKEKDFLALRISDRDAKQRARKWFTLPCSDNAID